jgi:hypothetical protein
VSFGTINQINIFFVICLPGLLIDISTKKEYIITDESLSKQMYDWIDCSISVK